MSRYIDADKLKIDLYNSGYCNNNWLDIEGYIDCQPTADVVEVVRCKDCKYYEDGVCANINFLAVQPDDYCSYAEKIEEAKDD